MHAGQRADARDAAAGAHDDAAVDLLAEDCVRAADVAGALRRDRGCLDAEATLAQGGRRLVHHLVARLAAVGQGEVEIALHHLEADHVALEQAACLEEQLLAGLVAVQHGDGGDRHQPNNMGRLPGEPGSGRSWRGAARVPQPSGTIDTA